MRKRHLYLRGSTSVQDTLSPARLGIDTLIGDRHYYIYMCSNYQQNSTSEAALTAIKFYIEYYYVNLIIYLLNNVSIITYFIVTSEVAKYVINVIAF